MKEFLLSLVSGRRDIPRQYTSLYEKLKSCGAITKDSKKNRYKLSNKFMVAQISTSSNKLFAKDITKPKDQAFRLKCRYHLAQNDIVLLLIATKSPKFITTLSAPSTHHRLVYLKQKRGRIVAIDCITLESIPLSFSQKSLKGLPRHCVLEIDSHKILRIIGSLEDPNVDEQIVLFMGKHPRNFSEETLHLAQSFGTTINPSLYPSYKDLCDKEFITIDPVQAKDFDDAIFWDQAASTLYVAIADVSEYVSPNTSLDKAAKERCFSLYLPHICHPMLPKELSESLCSLRANTTKLALVWEIRFNKRTKTPLHAKLYEALITPRANLDYDTIDTALSTKTPNSKIPQWIHSLYDLTQVLKHRRLQFGYDFYTQEVVLHLNEQNELESLSLEEPTPSHSLIEEAMLLANTLSAQALSHTLKGNGIYRTHQMPTKERICTLFHTLKELGYTYPKDSLHAQIQHLQKEAKKRDEAESKPNTKTHQKILDRLIIKAQKEAHYSPNVQPHFGLGFEAYTHFTSPIRRYSDIIAHRLLKTILHVMLEHTLHIQPNKTPPPIHLTQKAQRQIAFILESSNAIIPIINEQERKIAKMEMYFKDRKYVRFAQKHIGEKLLVRVVDEKYPAMCVAESLIIGARIFIEHTPLELECHKLYEASLVRVELINARIYASILK